MCWALWQGQGERWAGRSEATAGCPKISAENMLSALESPDLMIASDITIALYYTILHLYTWHRRQPISGIIVTTFCSDTAVSDKSTSAGFREAWSDERSRSTAKSAARTSDFRVEDGKVGIKQTLPERNGQNMFNMFYLSSHGPR